MLYLLAGFLRILEEVGKKKKKKKRGFPFLTFSFFCLLSVSLSNHGQFKVSFPSRFIFCCLHTEKYVVYHPSAFRDQHQEKPLPLRFRMCWLGWAKPG